jgi:SAM-dependent methyltransferase
LRKPELWRPTKYVRIGGTLRASRDPAHISKASRFIGDLVAPRYERAIQAHARGRLLDVGCGHVPLYDTYRSLVSENVCIDWENTLHANPHLDHTVDLTGPLPFGDAVFDTVLLTDVLEHIPEPMKLVAEIARVLRPGGRLIAGVPFLYWLHEEPHDYYRYTEFALRRFCERNQLRVLELDSYGGLPEVLFDLVSKGIDYAPRALAAPLRNLHAAASLCCRTRLVRRISRGTSGAFPLGYILVAEKAPDENKPLAGM